jgi:MYXO-CTERM domain-containing protein
MKIATLSKILGAGVIAFSLTALPVSAQTTTTPDAGTTNQPGTTTTETDNDNGTDWGWLGLLGLAGLFGLTGRKKGEPTAYRDPNATVGSTGYRE